MRRRATPTASIVSVTGAGAAVAILGLQEMPSARDIADNERCFGYVKLRSHTCSPTVRNPDHSRALRASEDLAPSPGAWHPRHR